MPPAIPTDLAEIAGMGDAVIRNLLITQRYHDLSRCLRGAIGGDDANWPTFATWASKTAGESIRGDEAPEFVRDLVERGTRHEQHDLLAAAVRRLVPGFVIEHSAIGAAARTAVCRVLPSGGHGRRWRRPVRAVPGRAAAGAGGASGAGRAAAGTSGLPRGRAHRRPRPRARLMLLGKALIGFHEQARLQPWIQRAMQAPVADTVVAGLRDTVRDVLPRGLEGFALRELDGAIETFGAVLEQEWNEIAGRYFMSLALPGGRRLELGANIPPLPDGAMFPALLLTIVGPEELVALIGRFDRSNDHGAGENQRATAIEAQNRVPRPQDGPAMT